MSPSGQHRPHQQGRTHPELDGENQIRSERSGSPQESSTHETFSFQFGFTSITLNAKIAGTPPVNFNLATSIKPRCSALLRSNPPETASLWTLRSKSNKVAPAARKEPFSIPHPLKEGSLSR